jgi:hypothetical protein
VKELSSADTVSFLFSLIFLWKEIVALTTTALYGGGGLAATAKKSAAV